MNQLDRELSEYLESMVEGMGRSERRRALELYLTGLLLDGERKSVEPMAARLVEDELERDALRQRLQQCVSRSDWSDREVRRRLACKLEEQLPGLEAFVVDDTGFAKKGEHSVGVTRQYSGTLGRTDNCQVAVSLHLAGDKGSGCIGMQLYLPEEWARDTRRRAAAGVPKQVKFQRKWEIALQQLDEALAWGVRRHVVLADAGYERHPFQGRTVGVSLSKKDRVERASHRDWALHKTHLPYEAPDSDALGVFCLCSSPPFPLFRKFSLP